MSFKCNPKCWRGRFYVKWFCAEMFENKPMKIPMMFLNVPKDKNSPLIGKLNVFTCVYMSVLVFFLTWVQELFRLGRYENFRVPALLLASEVFKYWIFKSNCVLPIEKSKKRSNKFDKLIRNITTLSSSMVFLYVTTILFGAPFLSDFEETFMFVIMLTVLGVIPLCLHFDVVNLFHLLDILTTPPKDMAANVIIFQSHLTFFGAWLGAITIPLDWDREWQIWPTPCVLGAVSGYFLANAASYLLQRTDFFRRGNKTPLFTHIL